MKRTFFLCCLLFVPILASADGMVWKVSDGKTSVYLGGTVHVLRKSDYPLPDAFEQAYKAADTLVFETDIDAIDSPVVQQRMMQMMSYENGRSLRDVLSADTYSALQQQCNAMAMPVENFHAFKPALVVVTLLYVELRRLGVGEQGVDKNFHQRARQDGKRLASLEDIDDHLGFVANMGAGEEDQFVLYSLRDMDRLPGMMEDLLRAWREVDIVALQKLLNDDFKQDFPKLYQSLLVNRNKHWLPQIEAMYQQQGTEYVLVGAAHLLGKEGLLAQLQQLGYSLEKL